MFILEAILVRAFLLRMFLLKNTKQKRRNGAGWENERRRERERTERVKERMGEKVTGRKQSGLALSFNPSHIFMRAGDF